MKCSFSGDLDNAIYKKKLQNVDCQVVQVFTASQKSYQ